MVTKYFISHAPIKIVDIVLLIFILFNKFYTKDNLVFCASFH